MSEYTSLTANIDGLMSAVKLTWVASPAGGATMASQSIYYTDVYESGDGGLIHDNKVLDVAATDASATITGLTSDRVYDFTIVGKDSADVEFEKDISANPHQLAGVPVFTLEKGNAQFTITVSNHKSSTEKYILFINGNTNDKIRTIAKDSGTIDTTNGTWTHTITGLTNSNQGVKSFYEVSVRAVNSVSTSAMSGSQSVEATDALPDVTGLEVLTGPERPANISSKAIVKFNAVPGATKYFIKAFGSSKPLSEMITDAADEATDEDDWFVTTNLFIHMNKNKQSGTDLAAGTKYRFAVVPYGTSLSEDSLAFVEATPSGKPDTTNIDLSGATGIDMSGNGDDMAFAEMNGKYKLKWETTKAEWEALGNGLPITALTFDISGQYAEGISKQIVVSGSDLSYTGLVTFDGLTNGKDYKVAVKTTNANGSSEIRAHEQEKKVSTRPTNFTLIAGPAVGAQDKKKNGKLDLSYNMNGNGLDVDRTGVSTDFLFDISGMDDTIKETDQTFTDISNESTVLGYRYHITAKAKNDNGKASPEQLTAIVKPSAPPTVAAGNFANSRIRIVETTDLNKIIVNFSNMVVTENGYPTTGARVRAVYDDSTNGNSAAWTGDWMIVNDLSKDVEINLPAIVNANDPHSEYTLEVEPFNAVYTKDYQIKDESASVAGYPDVMKSGLNKHTTDSINVMNSRLAITDLRMTSSPDEMDNKMMFKWRCDAADTRIELLYAEASLINDDTAYAVPKYADYAVIYDMSSVKYDAEDANPATTEMSFDLSDGDYLTPENSKAYYFMVREKAHPGNEKRAFGVSKTVPSISDLSFSDYKSRDLITFTVNPNGAKLSSLFLLNNIDPTGDFFFNVLESGAVPSSISEKLDSKLSGSIKVAIQKDQFQRNAVDFPQNVLFNVLAGNSAGVTLASATGDYADLNNSTHPYDAATTALEWAVKAEALAEEALALAATINGQAGNSNGVKNNSTPPMSPADTAAALVVAHAEFARGASDHVNAYAIQGLNYTAQAGDKGNNQTAESQYNLADSDLNALRLLSA